MGHCSFVKKKYISFENITLKNNLSNRKEIDQHDTIVTFSEFSFIWQQWSSADRRIVRQNCR